MKNTSGIKKPGPDLFASKNKKRRTHRLPRRYCFCLACIYLLLATQLFAQEALRIDDTTSSASVVSSSHYYAEPPNDIPADIRLVDETAWALTDEHRSKIKTEKRSIWLRFDLINESRISEWMLWTRFGWQTHEPYGYCVDELEVGAGAIHSNARSEIPIRFGRDSGRKNAFETTVVLKGLRAWNQSIL